MHTPVVLLTFHRPGLTAQVLDALRAVRPPALFVSSDGPRAGRPGEAAIVQAVRDLIDQVDWPCEVIRDYVDVNQGCRRRVSSALTRAFEQFDEAIVLEDDCLPHPDFFPFCEELLARYRHDDRVAHVGGNNFWAGRRAAGSSYVFSRYTHIWGWATWRRAWTRYDLELSGWPALRRGGDLARLFGDAEQAEHWTRVFDQAHARPDAIATWDLQWLLTSLSHGSLAVYPGQNLVTNIGFGADATHTTDPASRLAGVPARGLSWPLVHPRDVAHDRRADRVNFEAAFRQPPPAHRTLLGRVRRLVRAARDEGVSTAWGRALARARSSLRARLRKRGDH